MARNVLPDALRAAGMIVDVVPVYRTVADCENKEELLQALRDKAVDAVTFTSSSTVTNLLDSLGDDKDLLADIPLAVIGPVTAKTCVAAGLQPAVTADTYTIDGLVTAIQAYFATSR